MVQIADVAIGSIVPFSMPTSGTNGMENLGRWIYASFCKHFDALKGSYTLNIEGMPKTQAEEALELRIDGPYFKELSKNYWDIYSEVNVLCSCVKNHKNAYRIHDMLGLATSCFTRCINIYAYGDGGAFQFAMDRMDSEREKIQASYFGQVDPNKELEQATVEAHYSFRGPYGTD